VSDFTETIRRTTQRAAREKLLPPEMAQTGRAYRPGGAGGLLLPTGRVYIMSDTPEVLVRATHNAKWIDCNNLSEAPAGVGEDNNLKMWENPVVDDWCKFICHNRTSSGHDESAPYAVHIRPNTGQTILMPFMPTTLITPGQYIDFDFSGAYSCTNILTLVCTGTNAWTCVDCTGSEIGTD